MIFLRLNEQLRIKAVCACGCVDMRGREREKEREQDRKWLCCAEKLTIKAKPFSQAAFRFYFFLFFKLDSQEVLSGGRLQNNKQTLSNHFLSLLLLHLIAGG